MPLELIDKDDEVYINNLNVRIHENYDIHIALASITFWMTNTGEYIIGTSLVYGRGKNRYWVRKEPDGVEEIIRPCIDDRELISCIHPHKGLYLAYTRGLISPANKWVLTGRGDYDHSNVIMRIGNRIIPERLRDQREQELQGAA